MICRLCLNNLSERTSLPIFEEHHRMGDKTLTYMIAKHLFLELAPDDNISTNICQDCYDHLDDFHRFWTRIEQKQKSLQCEFLEIKCEEPIEDENIGANENMIKLPPTELDELSLIDAKLERFNDDYYSGNIVNVDRTDDNTELGILDGDVEIHYQENNDMSSDDEIPLMAYKNSFKKQKLKTEDSFFKCNITKKKQKTKKSDKSGKESPSVVKTESLMVLDNLELACELCKENVGDFNSLIKHFSAKHETKKAYVKCCRKTFTQKKKLINHLHWHRNPDEYRCNVCKKVLSSKKYLKLHMIVKHEGENVDVFKCNLCEKRFQSRKRLNNHNRIHKNEENFSCDVCGKSYTSRHRLQRHIQGTHEHVYPYKCVACAAPFNFKAELDKHFDTCKNKTLLSRITTGEALEEEKITEESLCKVCHKIFFNPRQLQRHIESIHEDIHPFVCDQCGKKFKFKPAFEKHLLEHSGIVEPPAQCNICGNWLKNKHSLRLHLYRHDAGNKKCHLCDRVCPSRRALKGHIQNVHRDEKHHKCKYCEKSFKNPKNLEEHIATHTGAQLYSCPHCSKETRSSSNMYVHIKRMHTEEWIKSKLARSNNPNVNIPKNKNDEK